MTVISLMLAFPLDGLMAWHSGFSGRREGAGQKKSAASTLCLTFVRMLRGMNTFSAISGPRGLNAAIGCTAGTLGVAWLAPPLLPPLLLAASLLGVLLLAYRHPIAFWIAWLLIAGLSLEMTLVDLAGPESFQIAIAAVKGAELCLVAISMARFGAVFDAFNPVWGFLAIAVAGMFVGIHPDLTASDVARSLIGSVTPFLIFFCRRPEVWCAAMLRAIVWLPLLSTVLGGILDLAGIRPVFIESGGNRLTGLGHPAFLAGVCLPAIYVGLLTWLRTGKSGPALLLGVNGLILLLTGARAPAAYAALVVGLTLLCAPGTAVPRARRTMLFLGALALAPILLIFGETWTSIRLFAVLASEAGHLSGRDLLWPAFEAAAHEAPWFGWGLGAGNVVIPHDSDIARLLHTWAAHNEYLRIRVEGGYAGRTVTIGLFILWISHHTHRLPLLEKWVMRVIFLSYAGHAATDNVLISTPACVFFAFTAAVFAGRQQPGDGRLPRGSPVA